MHCSLLTHDLVMGQFTIVITHIKFVDKVHAMIFILQKNQI